MPRKDDQPELTRREWDARVDALHEYGCVCCRINMEIGLSVTGYGIPEIHHLNEDGKAGNKRRGNRFTIPLCPYHHRGRLPRNTHYLPFGFIEADVIRVFGPALTDGGPVFRLIYGDDDALLARVNGEG